MTWYLVDDYDERYVMGFDMAKLTMDTFYLNLSYTESDYSDIFLYTLNEECVECPYLSTPYANINNNSSNEGASSGQIFSTNVKFRLATTQKEYFPQDTTTDVICDLDANFKQFGIYNIDLNKSGCYVNTLKDPVNIYAPIIMVILIYCLTALLIYGVCAIWKKWDKNGKAEEEGPKKERVRSLDTFRGIIIVLMIFANFGCGGYEAINHAKWNGLHAADLVFPCFMWIMGVCIPISLSSSFKKGLSNKTIFINVLKRSIKLFSLGVVLGSGADLNYLRIFGVLQRFGIAYLVVTTICVLFMNRSVKDKTIEELNMFDDVLIICKGWIIASALVIIHTLIIFGVAAPGCPAGYMGPGGLHKNQSYSNCVGGATGYIDGLILGNHRYQNPTIYKVYEARPFDPEGVVGCLMTIFHVFLGVQAGCTLILFKKPSQRLIRWLIWASATGFIGGLLCSFSKENGIIPVNKNLWSLSFVMVTSCFAFSLLSLCYVIIDVMNWWSGKPFLFAGMNAILMYIGHEMTDGHFPVRWYIHNDLGEVRRTHFLALFSDSWGVGVWILISYYLYKINYIFTV